MHGAKLLQVAGQLRRLPRRWPASSPIDYPVSLVNSVNPYRIEGQKTASFEIVDVLGDAPDIHCLPVGNAGNITAYWQGYREYAADGTGHPHAADVGLPGRRRRADRDRARWSSTRRRSPPRSGSATRRPGPRRWPPGTSPAAGSTPSPTGRSCAAYRLLARSEARLRRAGVGGVGRRAAAGRRGGRAGAAASGWSARSPATGSRTRSGRSPARPAPVTVPVDAAAAAAQLGLAEWATRPAGPRPGAGDQRQPGARRSTAPGWRCPAGTTSTSRSPTAAWTSRSPAPGPVSCPPTSRTWSCRRSGRRAPSSGWTPPGLRLVARATGSRRAGGWARRPRR